MTVPRTGVNVPQTNEFTVAGAFRRVGAGLLPLMGVRGIDRAANCADPVRMSRYRSKFGAGHGMKRKIGGVVRYLDCHLVASFRRQLLRVVAANG
jgi:hypothetical protein